MSRRDEFQQVAESVPFDNDTNGFDSDDTQAAVEEIDFRQLVKEPTGFVNRVDSVFSFVDATLIFSISPTTTSYDYYIRGHKYTISTTKNATITDTAGIWFFHFNESEVLIATQTPWDFEDPIAFVSILFWDATHNTAIILGEERHGLVMDWATHKRLHEVVGTQVEPNNFRVDDYILNGDGSLDTHAQFSITEGYIHDEDIIMDVVDSATPTPFSFEQTLSPFVKIPLYYREGSNADSLWHKIDTTNFPVAYDGINTIKYNYYDVGTDTWLLQSITNDYYMVIWVVATNNIDEPIIGFIGQREDPTLILSANLNTKSEFISNSGMPFTEFHFLWRMIYQSNTTYTNTPKAALRAATDTDIIIANNDRYQTTGWYGGNAGTNKYLFFSSVDSSLNAPFPFPEDSYIRTVSLYAVAASTGTITIFKKGTPHVAKVVITFINETSQLIELSEFFLKGDEIFAQVTAGSFTKPSLRIWIQTDLV